MTRPDVTRLPGQVTRIIERYRTDPDEVATAICAHISRAVTAELGRLATEQDHLHTDRAALDLTDEARNHAIRARAYRRAAGRVFDLLAPDVDPEKTAPLPVLPHPAPAAATTTGVTIGHTLASSVRRWARRRRNDT